MVNPFTLDEIKGLLQKSSGYMSNFIGIMAFSGIRPGELIGLKWDDVDLENEIFYVRRTKVRGNLGFTKIISSVRTIPMMPGVLEFFQEQRKITGDSASNMVFLNSSKKPFYSHDIIAKSFKTLLEKGDNRYLYQCRHSFATLMIANGESIPDISKMMGHKSLDITMKIYVKAYKVIEDKKLRKQMGSFLIDWHQSGTKKSA